MWTGKLQPHIEWELTKANVREVTQVEWTSKGDQEVKFVEYRFYLSRLPLYYTMYIIAPTIIVTGIVILVFHLPNIGGEKITLSISGTFRVVAPKRGLLVMEVSPRSVTNISIQ